MTEVKQEDIEEFFWNWYDHTACELWTKDQMQSLNDSAQVWATKLGVKIPKGRLWSLRAGGPAGRQYQ